MDSSTASAQAAIAEHEDWQQALASVLDETRAQRTSPVDLALLFASAAYGDDLSALVRRARAETGATVLIGCSGQGIIGPSRVLEGPPSVSLLTLSLPGANLEASYLGQRELEAR
jgi:small ligand-binding sensory domain FIST